MDCPKIELCQLYLWGEMSAEQAQAFASHLQECSLCRDELARLESVVGSLQKLQPEEVPQALAEQISQRLAAADRFSSPRLRLSLPKVLAIAASILVILGATVLWRKMLTGAPELPSGPKVKAAAFIDEDSLLALVLVMDEPEAAEPELTDPDEIISAEIEDLAGQIGELLEDIESELAPAETRRLLWTSRGMIGRAWERPSPYKLAKGPVLANDIRNLAVAND